MADFTLSAIITANATKFAEGFQKAKESLDGFAKKMDGFGKKMDSIGAGFTKAGATMTAGITVPLALGVKGAMDFEDGMANINTLLEDTTNFEKYGDAVLEASNRTGIGMDIMQNGMYQTISSLGDLGDETVGMFDMMVTSAKAGGAQVSDAVALISAGMKGYNDISAETAQKISDLAFETAKLGVTTFPEMASSMQPLFSLANSLNVSYEELFGTMATLTGVTGNTAEVTTQMKGVFSGLMRPTDAMTQLMEKYGYANAQAMIESVGLSGALALVKQETGGQADKMALLFGDITAITAATALCGAQYDTFNDKLAQMQDVTGATQTAYSKLETDGNSLRETLNLLKNTFVQISQTVLELLGPALQSIGEKAQQFSAFISGLTDGQKQLLGTILLIAAAIGPILVMIGGLFGSIAKIAFGMKSIITIGSMLAKGIASLFSLIAAHPIVAIVMAIVAVIVYLWNNCEWFRDGVIAAWEAIKSFFAGLPAFFSGIWDAISQWATAAWTNISNVVSAAWQAICTFFAPAVDFFAQIWNAISSVVQLVWGIIVACVQTNIAILTAAFQLIAIALTAVWNTVCSVASTVWAAICGFVSGAIATIVAVATPIVGVFQSVFSAVWGIVQSVFTVIGSFISSVFQGIEDAWNGLKGFVSGVFDGIFSAVQSLVSAVKGFVNGVIGGINGAIGLINMIPGVSIAAIPYLLHGTDDWSGGFARMNEGGRGELVYLPGGAQVIPHDISVQYAKEAARANASPQSGQTGTGSIGREIASAMRQVLAEQWGGGVLSIAVNLDSREVYRGQQNVAQSMGYNVGGMQCAW